MEVIIKEAGNRLDKALADLTELSRSQANEAIKAGTVLVNGKSAKAKYAVKEGDVITYELPEEEVLEYKAEDIPLDIIYEDADVAVVNKLKAWLSIHQLVTRLVPWSMPLCIMSRTSRLLMVWFVQGLSTVLTRTRLVSL